MWQDYIITIGLIVFSIALLPSVFGKQKPPLLTSIPTALVQFVFSVTFATLNLWFSAISQLISGILWAVIAVQVLRARKHNQ